jgi:hypothetical protein
MRCMAVYCSKCGEELLGAVNRCWKCGTPFVAPPVSAEVPPVRRSPVVLGAAPAAHTAAAGEASSLAAEIVGTSSTAQAANGQPPGVPTVSAAAMPTRRRGSPFADSHSAGRTGPTPVTVIQPARPYRPPIDYARPSAATGGAVASLILGILSLCGSYYIPLGALVAALLGIGMGLWGLYSERRGLAIAGLLLCCITLAVAGFFGAIDLYTLINGRRPWEPDPSLETGPLTDF